MKRVTQTVVFALAFTLMVATLMILRTYQYSEAVPLRKPLLKFPEHIGLWRGKELGLETTVVQLLGVSDYSMRIYHQPARPPVWLYVGYYRSQRQGETIHSPKHCYPGNGWHTLSSNVVSMDIPLSTHGSVRVNRYLIAKGLEKSLVFYWYHERGRVVASEYQAKLYLMLDAMTRHRTDGALVRVSSVVSDSVSATEQALVEFIQQFFPLLAAYVPD
jgi:EpsI family protein